MTVQQPLFQSIDRWPPSLLSRLQDAVVWLMFASSFYVIIEPAPSDVIFIGILVLFIKSGLSFRAAIAPLFVLLLTYNLGAFLSYLQILGDDKGRLFVETSIYMAVSAIFFAAYIADDTLHRAAIIRNAMIIAGLIASLFAIAGYLNIGGFVGGGGIYKDTPSAYNRAVGLFKDPNVFTTYIIFPALLLVQGFMLGEQRHKLISGISLLIILGALFLGFSRGAWISFVAATTLLTGFTYILAPASAIQMGTGKLRGRIALFVLVAVIMCVVMLTILLSFEQVRRLFFDRLTLVKEYDGGETGRFGNQINSIPMLLLRPLGFGPLQFDQYFIEAPHNVYINAFSSYGWPGGVSYIALMLLSIWVGFKSILMRTPWQNFALVVFCPLLTTIFQGVQIDTDHWRHFYWLLGLNWGLFAAGLNYTAKSRANPERNFNASAQQRDRT